MHRFQGTEQGPPSRLDLGGTHFNQLTNRCDNLAEAKEVALKTFSLKAAGEFLERGGYTSLAPVSGLISVKKKNQNSAKPTQKSPPLAATLH